MNVRVEYECTPIRHIAVQCPICGRWFNGRDITKDELNYDYQLYYTQFHCPICNTFFMADSDNDYAGLIVEEMSYPEIYKDCCKRKEVWG